MSGWRIVPVDMTPEMYEADVRCACDFKAEKMLGSGEPFSAGVYACYRAQLAAAPEPDWEALADAAFDAEAEAFAECVANGTVMQHGQHYARRISILAALRATFGSKP